MKLHIYVIFDRKRLRYGLRFLFLKILYLNKLLYLCILVLYMKV